MSASDTIAYEATLEAVGAGRPQNWQKAFDSLRRAAQQGSLPASAQLAVLRESPSDGDDLDIGELLKFPSPQPLSERPRIRIIKGFASPSECKWLQGKGNLGSSRVFDVATGEPCIDPRRNNSSAELELEDLDVVTQVIRARISGATRLPLPVFEPPQILRYTPGQEFQPHFDYLESSATMSAGQRIATFLLYLNDKYEDGETEFPRVGIRHRGKLGDALFFANVDLQGQPDPLTLHSGRPPSRGEKWVLSQWIRDRSPVRQGG